jgi:hypothetical protein
MNYLVTESQLKVIVNEQRSDYAVDRQSNAIMNASGIRSKEDYNTVNSVTKKAMEGATIPLDDHTVMTILQIGSAFIPLIGPLLSVGIGLADAALYYKEGDTKTAGLVALFSCIPGVGGLSTKLGLTKWTSKALGELGKKISMGSKLLPQEIQAAKIVAKNKNLILADIKASPVIAKQIAKQVATTVGKTAATVGGYAAAGGAYSKAYDAAQKNTPRAKAESEGLNWAFVKSAFGSSGTEQDNTLLNRAWAKSWRPGKIVPQEFQTTVYKDNYNTEIENIKTLNSIVSNATT